MTATFQKSNFYNKNKSHHQVVMYMKNMDSQFVSAIYMMNDIQIIKNE